MDQVDDAEQEIDAGQVHVRQVHSAFEVLYFGVLLIVEIGCPQVVGFLIPIACICDNNLQNWGRQKLTYCPQVIVSVLPRNFSIV